MIRKLPLAFPLFLLVLVSGCISGINVEDIVKADPVVSKFLDEHPNAEIKITLFTEEQSQNIIEDVKIDCENPYLEAGSLYRINITDPSTGFYMTVWLDWEEKTITCAVKRGTEPVINDTEEPSQSGLFSIPFGGAFCTNSQITIHITNTGTATLTDADFIIATIDGVDVSDRLQTVSINPGKGDVLISGYNCGGGCGSGSHAVEIGTSFIVKHETVYCSGSEEPVVCGDGICGEGEDCLQDCSFKPSHGMITLECTSAAGGFFNSIVDVGEMDNEIAGMTIGELGGKFVCKSGQTDYGCIVDVPPEDVIIEVGKTDVSGNWNLANTRVPGTLEKQIVGPGNWTLGGASYQNEGKHLFLYLHFTKETHPTNKKCWIGDTWLENADESTKSFYKCCYDYDGDEREVRVYIRIPGTNKYVYTNYLLHNHKLTIGPSKPVMIEETIPIDVQVQSIHGHYDEGPAGFSGYVVCVDIEDEVVDGDISIYIDGLEYTHTGEGIGNHYGICEDESFGIRSSSPWGYSGLHDVKVGVAHGGREGEDTKSIDFSEKTVTVFTVERHDENCGTFCTNYTYHITAGGDSLPQGMSYLHEYTPGGDHVRILQPDGKTIDLETYGYCTCNTFGTLPVCTGTGGVTCTPQTPRFDKVVYDGTAVTEGYCKSIGVGITICFDSENSVNVES